MRVRPSATSLSLAILAALALVLVVSAVVFSAGWVALGQPRPPGSLDQSQFLDAVKVGLAVVAGLGAAVGLTVSYRRQATDEDRREAERDQDFEARFSSATTKLGDLSAAVRLAGVHALARLADDWSDQRQMCIDVLCAYFRLPSDPASIQLGETEVRNSILRVVRDHLRPGDGPSWDGLRFDFTGARFEGGDFSRAHFANSLLLFNHATFAESRTSFIGSRFQGGSLVFRGATF